MISILSLVTSVKDYVEVVHKLIESDSSFKISDYSDLGPIITYIIITLKEFFYNLISLNWLKSLWDLPIIVPNISSAMISEISVLDGYVHNAFNFLDTPLSYGDTNLAVSSLEKLIIGLINSLFIFIPTGTAHLITLRRFVMQGLEAGYISGLGSICGNILWITSIIFGWRFFVIPWLSLDIFRYILGFVILVKYMWDSYNERKTTITSEPAKQKIFLLSFLLSLTEQTSIYPFISNISIGSESSILEGFPSQNWSEFLMIHGSYIFGLTLGCLSLLQLTCWFWENPAFKIYMWMISSFKVSTSFYYKVLNFTFLYLTMICAISSIPYYGLDYALTNPIGFVQDDRILDQKLINPSALSFLNSKASDRNTRRNRGRHGRRERWKRRIRKYRTFDASLYDQGVYDLFTIEDLNYGFDRFWLRRKMRNHTVRFRFFPGPWMRSFKKQLAKPRLESYAGPRQEFFRILFEQVYHPSFHEYSKENITEKIKINGSNVKQNLSSLKTNMNESISANNISNLVLNNKPIYLLPKKELSLYLNIGEKGSTINNNLKIKENLKIENSTLRKFVRKINNRLKNLEIKKNIKKNDVVNTSNIKPLYSKRWKQLFSKLNHSRSSELNTTNRPLKGLLKNFYQNSLSSDGSLSKLNSINISSSIKKQNSLINLSKKDEQILKYRSIFLNKSLLKNNSNIKNESNLWLTKNTINFLHPLKFYLKKQQSFERKLRYYTPTIFRKFSIENNAPYFRIMMKRYFYYFKPTLRWEKTMKVGSLRKARRKTSTSARKIQFTENSLKSLAVNQFINSKSNVNLTTDSLEQKNLTDQNKSFSWKNRIVKPTHNYTIVGKRASRYRYQIYKDVLQHWYYSPFNRLLLKLDIDLFIKRQPKPHFIGKNEANLLFLRRSLLTEHYNTLRWYTYMQHYRSMKTKIGGTKSFASGTYNQQFTGTFKKIRHLFAITPSQNNQTILKFDQPLYNEYYNNSNNNYQKNILIHEELLPETEGKINNNLNLGNDLVNQSNQILRDYLIKSYPIKKEYITNLIENKNYDELTKFLYKGEKTRGDKPVINEKTFIGQEKDYLLTKTEKEELTKLDKIKSETFLRPVQQDLWINLLKKWKRKINDQEFLKNYLQRRVEKSEKRRIKKEKNLKTKLQRLENLFSQKEDNETNLIINSFDKSQNIMSTGVQKALVEGISTFEQTSSDLNKKSSLNLNNIENKSILTSNPKIIETKILQETLIRKKEKQLKYSLDKLSQLIKKVPFQQINKNNNLNKSRNNNNNNDKFLFNSLNRKQMTFKIKSIYTHLKVYSTKLVKIKLLNILKPIRNKTIKNWQQEERSLNKQKRVRKEFKTFIKKPFKDITMSLNEKEGNNIIKKRDYSNKDNEINNNDLSLSKQIWGGVKKTYNTYLTKKFKRKKSPQRRARTRKNRGVTKKRTLSDSLKREFKNIRKYNLSSDKEQKTYRSIAALNFYSSINKEFILNSNESFKRVPLQRRSKQKKQRYWKQKRSKFSQNLRKYKKRRRSVLAKVRILNKQLKRIKSTTDLKKWWWTQFLPNFRATINSLWQTEKDQYLLQKLLALSTSEIIERDKLAYLNTNSINLNQSEINRLQVGNFDYKPLSLPTTIKMVNELKSLNENKNLFEKESLNENFLITNSLNNSDPDKNNIISNVVKTTLLPKNQNVGNSKNSVIITNPIPFYAGWDESLRKFVVTNRLLSRRESGNEMDLQDQYQKEFKSLLNQEATQNTLTFNAAPLKGMNAATTLYWQIPFTTYDPDQFFALGMDGFAPLGWRRFQFRHSILKSWLYDKTINSVEQNSTNKLNNSLNNYIVKNKLNIIEAKQLLINNKFTKNYTKNIRNINRRVKKRYRRVKKHPRSPVWFPSGPLLNQVLPVHYIYIFYKRSRLPRDRYIKRRLRKSKTINLNKNNTITSKQAPDFTLRKRIKTKRKYHIKQTLNRKSPIIPRRMIFIGDDSSLIRWRPLSKQKLNKPIAELIKEQRTLRSKQRKKEQQEVNNKQPANIRVKQLRRRVQRQIIRSVWRYKPRAGGFVWPGDYLKLELQKTPKLKSLDKITVEMNSDSNKTSTTNIKMKRKKKRNIQEWQIQTKKYLLQKHNYNVIKKKLEKAHRSNKIKERIKELNLTF